MYFISFSKHSNNISHKQKQSASIGLETKTDLSCSKVSTMEPNTDLIIYVTN